MITEDIVVGGIFIIVVAVWGVTVMQSHRLFYKFAAKYPDIASKEIPYAFSRFAHPMKATYFFTKRCRLLLRNDPELWQERNRLIYLCLTSLIFPSICMLGLLVFFILSTLYSPR